MDYQQYFDDLSIGISPEDARKVIEILDRQADNPAVTEYNGLQEMVFEVMISLFDENNFIGIESFQELLIRRYPDVYAKEKGQFLSILMEWYLKQGKEEQAAEAWREWYQSEYDYDLILGGLDVLVLYHQSSLVNEFIDQEFLKVKTSPRLIPGAEVILRIYKMYIEFGRFIDGKSTPEDFDEELHAVDGELNSDIRTILNDGEQPLPVKLFSTNRQMFIQGVAYRAQSFMQRKHAIPFLCSAYLLETYFDLLTKNRSNNYAAYFKTSEDNLSQHLQNHAGERMLGEQDALALVHLLPVFYAALVEQGIFNQTDADKESAKARSVFTHLARKFPQGIERAGHLRLYPGFEVG